MTDTAAPDETVLYTQAQLDAAVAAETARMTTVLTAAANRACDDVIAATGVGDVGARDAFNLLVNAAVVYAEDPDGSLSLQDVAASCYDQPLAEVLAWIGEL